MSKSEQALEGVTEGQSADVLAAIEVIKAGRGKPPTARRGAMPLEGLEAGQWAKCYLESRRACDGLDCNWRPVGNVHRMWIVEHGLGTPQAYATQLCEDCAYRMVARARKLDGLPPLEAEPEPEVAPEKTRKGRQRRQTRKQEEA